MECPLEDSRTSPSPSGVEGGTLLVRPASVLIFPIDLRRASKKSLTYTTHWLAGLSLPVHLLFESGKELTASKNSRDMLFFFLQ